MPKLLFHPFLSKLIKASFQTSFLRQSVVPQPIALIPRWSTRISNRTTSATNSRRNFWNSHFLTIEISKPWEWLREELQHNEADIKWKGKKQDKDFIKKGPNFFHEASCSSQNQTLASSTSHPSSNRIVPKKLSDGKSHQALNLQARISSHQNMRVIPR